MLAHRAAVAKRIQDLQLKAYPTHCHGHSQSQSVKDTMDTAKEVVTLIKFSPECRKI